MLYWFQRCQKFYEIRASKNLLGQWQITRRYGRIGSKGRYIHEILGSKEHMRQRVESLIQYRIHRRHYTCVIEKQ